MARRSILARRRVAVGLVLALAAQFAMAQTRIDGDAARVELRLRYDLSQANPGGPIADANALASGIAADASSHAVAEAELRGTWRAPSVAAGRAALTAAAVIDAGRRTLTYSHETRADARLIEGFAAGDFGHWQASAGKKVVAWDIGYGFRPNDVVQQEVRRTLLALPQQGRPLLEAERYGAQTAAALVWVNPHHANAAPNEQRGAAESAVAARAYARDGAADWHFFGRWGRHTRASVGTALAWVVSDELELHASTRLSQRHDRWQIEPQAMHAPRATHPWHEATLGRAAQALVGASWTGERQISVIAEWWYDGTAMTNREWDGWRSRNVALAALGGQSGLPQNLISAIAGNLAWQATPFAAGNLRRNNVFARLSWQPARWVVSLDALVTPSDRGQVVTAAAQWQGETLRINAAWRSYGGPADALFAQLPQRSAAVLAATWSF
jgi:hypothetical protein